MTAVSRFMLRRREKLRSSLRYTGSSGFGRALYRESGRLDAMAREAGLTPLSELESADPLDARELPVWHAPEAALPTVEHREALLPREDLGRRHQRPRRGAAPWRAQRVGRRY